MRDHIVPADRRAAAADRADGLHASSRCWPTRSSSTAGSAPTPISSICSTCAALAVPAAMRADGAPSGVTLLAPAGHDAVLASIGRAFHADTGLPLGALGVAQPPLAAAADRAGATARSRSRWSARISPACRSMASSTRSARACSKRPRPRRTIGCIALAGTHAAEAGPAARRGGQGAAIEVEVWALPAEGFGRFVAAIPPPLVDRHAAARRRAQREGLSGRGARPSTGARDISQLRRLARLHGAGKAQAADRVNALRRRRRSGSHARRRRASLPGSAPRSASAGRPCRRMASRWNSVEATAKSRP